ncbi:MAG: DUF1003 domain-containing protein [Methanoregula sp.]|uniref:DUF1003 domain-containing protein n=2 Tax=Methanoregula sp. TaxID=2052170 RepID=UPI003BAFFBD4
MRGKEMADQGTFSCQICGIHKRKNDLVPAELVPASIVDIVTKEHPAWSPEGYICKSDLNRFRIHYIRDVAEKEKNEYASFKGTVSDDTTVENHLPKNDNIEYEKRMTFGERVSDRLAEFAGSWTFIGVFTAMLFLWVILNSTILLSRAFDPYPYILLNLVLSVVAAIQAPIIIMSQNRQEVRDRLHAERDFEVSIHTDSEIHRLHKKIDYLATNQAQKLMEFQSFQLEFIEELLRKTD